MILRPVMQYSFNPRTPRGVRPGLDCPKVINYRFQSTHPARGATGQQEDYHLDQQVSIHAPREGCDVSVKAVGLPALVFQSTHPARGATHSPLYPLYVSFVSIHAPREGCDHGALRQHKPEYCFNPRTPRGVRPYSSLSRSIWLLFQSTHPARGATIREWDSRWLPYGKGFNPRTPRGVRLAETYCLMAGYSVSIHAPREGGDL